MTRFRTHPWVEVEEYMRVAEHEDALANADIRARAAAEELRRTTGAYERSRVELLARIAEESGRADNAETEAIQWRHAHRSVVISKRRLSAKYGAIMRRKPRARLRRLRKWIGGRR